MLTYGWFDGKSGSQLGLIPVLIDPMKLNVQCLCLHRVWQGKRFNEPMGHPIEQVDWRDVQNLGLTIGVFDLSE